MLKQIAFTATHVEHARAAGSSRNGGKVGAQYLHRLAHCPREKLLPINSSWPGRCPATHEHCAGYGLLLARWENQIPRTEKSALERPSHRAHAVALCSWVAGTTARHDEY